MSVLKALEKEKPSTIGLYQALGVAIYCSLVALFFSNIEYIMRAIPKPGFIGFFMMLVIFVFSAAVTGSLVFGYPAYLVIVKKKVQNAINILAFTLLFAFAIILITLILILTLFS